MKSAARENGDSFLPTSILVTRTFLYYRLTMPIDNMPLGIVLKQQSILKIFNSKSFVLNVFMDVLIDLTNNGSPASLRIIGKVILKCF